MFVGRVSKTSDQQQMGIYHVYCQADMGDITGKHRGFLTDNWLVVSVHVSFIPKDGMGPFPSHQPSFGPDAQWTRFRRLLRLPTQQLYYQYFPSQQWEVWLSWLRGWKQFYLWHLRFWVPHEWDLPPKFWLSMWISDRWVPTTSWLSESLGSPVLYSCQLLERQLLWLFRLRRRRGLGLQQLLIRLPDAVSRQPVQLLWDCFHFSKWERHQWAEGSQLLWAAIQLEFCRAMPWLPCQQHFAHQARMYHTLFGAEWQQVWLPHM